MAVITWPDINYNLDRNSFSLDPNDQVARSDFEDGPQMVRQRFTNPTYIYSGSITMTNAEFMVFNSFFKNTIRQGTSWFTMPIWVGNSYVTHSVRFKEKYTVNDAGFDQYTVNVALEIRDYFTYNTFTLYALSYYGEELALIVADTIQLVVNDEYPSIFTQGHWPPV